MVEARKIVVDGGIDTSYNIVLSMSFLNKLLNWYFNKKSLPYWCLFLIDSVIVLFSGLFTYWIFNRTMEMFTHRFDVLYTSLFYVVVSWIGARVFRTYSGVVRYSSFVDLQRVAYANLLSAIIAIITSMALEHWDMDFYRGKVKCQKIEQMMPQLNQIVEKEVKI